MKKFWDNITDLLCRRMWSRLTIILIIATVALWCGKINGTEWVAVAAIFAGVDLARKRFLSNGNGNYQGGD